MRMCSPSSMNQFFHDLASATFFACGNLPTTSVTACITSSTEIKLKQYGSSNLHFREQGRHHIPFRTTI